MNQIDHDPAFCGSDHSFEDSYLTEEPPADGPSKSGAWRVSSTPVKSSDDGGASHVSPRTKRKRWSDSAGVGRTRLVASPTLIRGLRPVNWSPYRRLVIADPEATLQDLMFYKPDRRGLASRTLQAMLFDGLSIDAAATLPEAGPLQPELIEAPNPNSALVASTATGDIPERATVGRVPLREVPAPPSRSGARESAAGVSADDAGGLAHGLPWVRHASQRGCRVNENVRPFLVRAPTSLLGQCPSSTSSTPRQVAGWLCLRRGSS